MDHFFHPFLGDLRAELKEAKAANRKGIFVMYHFEACPSCTRMKQTVLNLPHVQDWYRSQFQVLGIDTLGDQPVTGFDGRTLPEKDYAKARRVRASPSFDFYDLEGRHVYRHAGGLFEPAEFLLLGRYVADGAYRDQTFAEYRRARARKGS